ncbi:MAG: serine/threonine-protein kinase PknD [Chlamydiales bacterium]
MHKLGRYECLEVVGTGGMGEILLAYDPLCGRHIAIKRIRRDLQQHAVIRNRFLREARITAQLTHPGIISIYSIHQDENEIYYTMPYVKRETLKQIFKHAYQNMENQKEGIHSIPALLQIFKSICQTVAYAHSKGILHRDLKPENILIGKFGEVIILDWGLAQFMNEPSEEIEEKIIESNPGLTNPGKLVGTVAYMAPERALGSHATVQTDLYALGVILYQILTLQIPFKRVSLKEFSKTHVYEKLIDPEEIAPYREVPPHLSRIVKKCLEANPVDRYQTMDELIYDLINHMEGRSDWFEMAHLDPKIKKHWEFQENVLISKYIAITRTTETTDWVSIMVSKGVFAETLRLKTKIQIDEHGEGIGFLLSIPEAADRETLFEGYCLWIASDLDSSSQSGLQLFRNMVEVLHRPDLCLKRNELYSITIEKIAHNIHFFINEELKFTYLSYLPLFGTRVGLISRDHNFKMESLVVLSGSQNLQVSCLSIPDAFLASKDYKRALTEYRRIGYSFPGYAEGREALFRAGITLLEQARAMRTQKKAEENYTLALEEFAKLHKTTGAPLEYLGKALVYQSLRDYPEEIKCLELGLRRYKKHPLINAIREQIIYRMHEASQTNRRSAYQLILIVLRLLPKVVQSGDSNRLFKHLVSHWEQLPFFESPIDLNLMGKEKSSEIRFAIPLAFWLGAPYTLLEIYQELIKIRPLDIIAIGDLLYALFELGSYRLAYRLIEEAEELKSGLEIEEGTEFKQILDWLKPIWICHTRTLTEAFTIPYEDIGVRKFRTISYLLQYALRTDQLGIVHEVVSKVRPLPLAWEDSIMLDAYEIWAYLKEKNWEAAGKLFESYPLEMLNQEGTLLYSLYGCYLYVTEGEEISKIYFSGVIDTPFPRSWALLGHELTNKITESVAWYSTSFLWERRRLYQHMTLYYQCRENPDLEAYYRHLEREEYVYIPE